MLRITKKPVPSWYQISWDAEQRAIVIGLYQDIVSEVFKGAENWRIVDSLIRNNKFRSFVSKPEEGFGFDDLGLKPIVTADDFQRFALALPAVERLTDQPCSVCHGKKIDEFFERDCLYCSGTGRERIVDWSDLKRVAFSLMIFLMRLDDTDEPTKATTQQLMTLTTGYVSDRVQPQAPLGGAYSFPLAKWISETTSLQGVVRAMKDAYSKMFLRQSVLLGFRAEAMDHGRLHLNLGMNCACLGVRSSSSQGLSKGEGHEFDSHNVDTLAQQMTLVAGLANLCDQAREELK